MPLRLLGQSVFRRERIIEAIEIQQIDRCPAMRIRPIPQKRNGVAEPDGDMIRERPGQLAAELNVTRIDVDAFEPPAVSRKKFPEEDG